MLRAIRTAVRAALRIFTSYGKLKKWAKVMVAALMSSGLLAAWLNRDAVSRWLATDRTHPAVCVLALLLLCAFLAVYELEWERDSCTAKGVKVILRLERVHIGDDPKKGKRHSVISIHASIQFRTRRHDVLQVWIKKIELQRKLFWRLWLPLRLTNCYYRPSEGEPIRAEGQRGIDAEWRLWFIGHVSGEPSQLAKQHLRLRVLFDMPDQPEYETLVELEEVVVVPPPALPPPAAPPKTTAPPPAASSGP